MNHIGDFNKMVSEDHFPDANKMVSDTPRTTDRVVFIDGNPWVNAPFARGLERELNAANQRIDMLTACNADVARIAKERDDALKRIKRLEEFVDQLTNPKFTRDDLPKEALLQRIKRLEEAGDRIIEAGWSVQDWSGMCVVWAKAKEAKP